MLKPYFMLLIMALFLQSPVNQRYVAGSNSLDNNDLLYWHNNVFWKVDQNTLTAEPFLEIPPEDNHFFAGIMYFDREQNMLYFQENEGERYGFRNRLTSIFQYNINTGIQEIIWQEENINWIAFSLDTSRIAISHLQPYSRENSNRPPPEFCVLDISEQTCRDITDNLPRYAFFFRWLNEQTLGYPGRDNRLTIFDTVTGENEEIELEGWDYYYSWIYSWMDLAGEDVFAIGLNRETNEPRFISFNALTKDVLVFDYGPDVDVVSPRVPRPSILSVSPNQRYVVYSLTDIDYQIVDLSSGDRHTVTLANTDNIRSGPEWYPNSEGFLIATIEDYTTDGSPESLSYVEAKTGIMSTIQEFDVKSEAPPKLVSELR